jgi:hypothetical protein
MKHAFRVTTLAAAGLMVLSGSAMAGTFSQSPDPANVVVGGSASTVQFLFAGDGQTDNAQLDIQLSSVADLTITANAPLVPGATCTVIGADILRIVPPDASATASTLPAAATAYCSFNFTAGAAAAQGLRTWTANLVECSALGNPVTPCTFTQTAGTSGINVTTAPPDTNLSYSPAAGTNITFPSGVALTTQNASITVTGTGTVGSGTVTGCGITGPGAASFGAPPGNLTVNAGASAPLNLSCTLPNSGGAATATLTCTETDADSPAPGATRTWPLTCPQGTPVPGPGFGATPAPNPAPAAPITCDGQPGATVQRQIVITNNGNPGAGSDLTFTCTASGVASIVSGGTTATPLAVGASQTVVVACTAPADGVTEVGAVSCTSNAPGSPFAFNYSSTGSSLPPPVARPAVIPASSFWSMAALITLLAGFGVALVGFRRK